MDRMNPQQAPLSKSDLDGSDPDPRTASLGTETLGTETLGASRAAGRDAVRRGDSLGRYMILEPVGRGGMGQVYAAYDPKLDRKIALKVLTAGRADLEAMRSRLIREARALARLSHPNVVAVFDAEAVGDRVFIATEFIVGQTLTRWLRDETRSRRAIVEVLLQAGRGLAAAHDVGLVHRDVKGGNVMVADDGRVVVLDFGLARELRAGDDAGEVAEAHSVAQGLPPADRSRTRTGAVLGTPAFMAPEQRRGERVGPAADQYSFCAVTLHALTGVLPADDVDGAAMATLPAGLRRLLQQGLRDEPGARHASMAAVLKVLARESGRRHRLIAGAVLALVALGVAVGLWLSRDQPALTCAAGAERFQAVWNATRQAQLQPGAMAATDGSAAWVSTLSGLDDYAAQWSRMYRDACQATYVDRSQSQELLDLRMDCLDQRLQEVDAGLDLLSPGPLQGDVRELDAARRAARAAQWVSHLPALRSCADTRALRSPSPPPVDAEARRQLTRLRRRLAEVKALWMMGDYAGGQASAAELADTARSFGYWPLIAEIELEEARFHESLGDGAAADEALGEALLAAHAGGHAQVAAEALIRRVRVQGYQLRLFDAAESSATHADGVLERLSEPASLAAELDEVRGLLAVQRGQFDVARSRFENALERKQALLGKDHLALAATLSRLAEVALEQSRLDDAEAHLSRALAIDRRHLGDDHPNVAGVLSQLGTVDHEAGRAARALERHQDALRIRRQSFGDDHVRVAMSLTEVANALTGLGRFQEAEASFERSVEVFERHLGADHPFVAIAISNLAATLIRQDRASDAVPLFRRALRIQQLAHGSNHPRIAQALFNVGESLRRSGRGEEAIPLLQEAADLWQREEGASQLIADAWTALGEAHLDASRPEHALPLLERALGVREDSSRRPDLWAKNAFALARALDRLGRQPQRVQDLARAARERYGHVAASHRRDIETIDAWLERFES